MDGVPLLPGLLGKVWRGREFSDQRPWVVDILCGTKGTVDTNSLGLE